MRCQLWRSTEAAALAPGALPAFAGALLDQAALEFGKTAQNGEDQAPCRRRGIGPAISKRLQLGTLGLDHPHGVQQVKGGAGQTVEPGDDEYVTLGQGGERPGQLGPVGSRPAHGLLEHGIAPLGSQLLKLGGEGLAGGGDAGVADGFHGCIMHATYARYKPLFSWALRKRAKVLIFARPETGELSALFLGDCLTEDRPVPMHLIAPLFDGAFTSSMVRCMKPKTRYPFVRASSLSWR